MARRGFIVQFLLIVVAVSTGPAATAQAIGNRQRKEVFPRVALAEARRVARKTAPPRRPSSRRRRMLKELPPPVWDRRVIDVFFPDALARLGSGKPPAESVAASIPREEAADPTAAESSGGFRWSTLISRDVLEDEIKRQLPLLAESVRTASVFKARGYRVARQELSLLAVLFGVIAQYDGEVRWKTDAAGMVALLSRAGVNCKAASAATHKEAKRCVESLGDLIRGGSANVSQATVPEAWSQVADRRPLMLRMKDAERGRLDTWTANQQEFDRNKETIVHEAQILAVLAEVIQSDGYEYAEDDGYRRYAEELKHQCRAMLQAVAADQFEPAQSAAVKANKSCDDCHGDYRE